MRILVLTHEYPPIGGGGGRVAQDLCQGFARRGHEVLVLTARHGSLPAEEQHGQVRIRRLDSGRRLAYKADLRAMGGYVWRSFWDGIGIIRRWKPHLIHAHFAVPAGAAAWGLSRLTGVPYVLTAHLGDVPGGVPEKTGRWFRWIDPFTPPIWRRAAQVVAVSGYTRQLAQQRYPVPVKVIYNGVDLEALDPGEIQVHNPPRLVFAGRLAPQKNPLLLVQALAALQHLPWECVLIGDGELRPAVEEEICRCGLQERFTLTGWIDPPQVIEWYRRSDVLFMPSLSEGLPVAGVQALAMGLALVLSRVGGCVDLVQPGENGFLVESGNREGFVAALQTLLSDKDRLLAARRASRRLAEKFDLNTVVESYEQIFAQAVPKK
jgi:glycosyltransferase involved in cell wall biosynthesis